mmetsp:Transcript_7413/g.21318  ORF Transcript_7413/g.21318 Transcript_7413/m.21318 type:complete len:224 (+) Transcript_7413:124-795(+)
MGVTERQWQLRFAGGRGWLRRPKERSRTGRCRHANGTSGPRRPASDRMTRTTTRPVTPPRAPTTAAPRDCIAKCIAMSSRKTSRIAIGSRRGTKMARERRSTSRSPCWARTARSGRPFGGARTWKRNGRLSERPPSRSTARTRSLSTSCVARRLKASTSTSATTGGWRPGAWAESSVRRASLSAPTAASRRPTRRPWRFARRRRRAGRRASDSRPRSRAATSV